MTVEFHLPAFNIRIILNGIYSIYNSIVPFIKVFFRIVRHRKDTGIYRCTFAIKNTRDTENSVDYCPPLIHDVRTGCIPFFPSPSGYLPVFGVDKQKTVKQSVGKELCTEDFLQHICLY